MLYFCWVLKTWYVTCAIPKFPLFVINPQKRWLFWFYQRFMSNSWKLFQDHRSNLWLIKILQRRGFGKKMSNKWNLKKISLDSVDSVQNSKIQNSLFLRIVLYQELVLIIPFHSFFPNSWGIQVSISLKINLVLQK